jgi:hypothetical protein
MARSERSKPTNVVKSRTAPSLLGAPTTSRREELPRNRFIELGDIALGNSGRPLITQHVVPPADSEDFRITERLPIVKLQLPDAELLTGQVKPPKRPKMELPRPQLRRLSGTPISRPKPPALPKSTRAAAPKSAVRPKHHPPKPPKMTRPKPKTAKPFATLKSQNKH